MVRDAANCIDSEQMIDAQLAESPDIRTVVHDMWRNRWRPRLSMPRHQQDLMTGNDDAPDWPGAFAPWTSGQPDQLAA